MDSECAGENSIEHVIDRFGGHDAQVQDDTGFTSSTRLSEGRITMALGESGASGIEESASQFNRMEPMLVDDCVLED